MTIELSSDSKEVIRSYRSSGYFSAERAEPLLYPSTKNGFISEFKDLFNLDIDRVDKIWRYVRNNIWKTPTSRDREKIIFKGRESFFFNYLLNEGGIVCMHTRDLNGLFYSPDVRRDAVDSLKNRKLIKDLSFSTNEVFYILDFDFYMEVFGDAEKNRR